MRPQHTRLAAAAASLVLVVGLTACGGDDDATKAGATSPTATTTDPATAPTTEPPTVPPTSTSTGSSTGSASSTSRPDSRITNSMTTSITLSRRGGIGGMDDQVTVRPDGSYTVTLRGQKPVSRQLSESAMSAISDAARKTNLASQPKTTVPAHSDQLTYTIKVGSSSLTTTEGTAPKAVRALLDELNALFSQPGSTR